MKSLGVSILVAVLIIGGAIFLSGKSNVSPGQDASGDDGGGAVGGVSIVDGKQIIEVTAKGGYFPSSVVAKAGMPSVLKVKTSGTFDCSSALSIPKLGYRNILPNSGETLIDIPAQEPGAVVNGVCAMGMYNFQIKYE